MPGPAAAGSAASAAPVKWGPPESWQSTGTHHGFSIRESANYTFFYEPDRLTREELDTLANAREAAYPSLKSLAPPGHDPGHITYYLYPTVDRKIDETARDEVVHVDLATGEIHAVYSRLEHEMEPYLDIMVMLHRSIGPTRVPQLERALAIAMAPDFQGRDIEPMAARLFQDMKGRESAVLEALRDQDVITPADGPPSAHDMLLAAFMKDLVRRHGREQAFDFVARASPGRLDGVFQQVYRLDMSRALADWGSTMRTEPGFEAAAAAPAPLARNNAAPHPVAQDTLLSRGLELLRQRDDIEAARILQEALRNAPGNPTALCALARLKFRHGEFDAAEKMAQEALASCSSDAASKPECAEASAWSHLTIGRAEAVRGRYITARIELTHPGVTGGPEPVPTLADYWLLTMGQSRNQLTVISHIKREARISLRNLDWREAEASLKRALEIDPTDGEAHKLLSEVYHKEHEYWAWQIRYLNEIHPDYNVLSGIYVPRSQAPFAARVEQLHSIDSFNDLVLRGNVELLKAQSLYAVEVQNLHAEGDRFLLERRDIPEALRMYKRALELNPDFFLSHFLVGRCYFLMDRFEDARRSFEEVLKRKPADKLVAAWTYTYLGYIALQADDLSGARRDFERALAHSDQGKVGALAHEGLGRVDTIRLVAPRGLGH